MQIRCEIKENGDIQVACCCLKTDTWLDYISFKQDAREAFATGCQLMPGSCEPPCFRCSAISKP